MNGDAAMQWDDRGTGGYIEVPYELTDEQILELRTEWSWQWADAHPILWRAQADFRTHPHSNE